MADPPAPTGGSGWPDWFSPRRAWAFVLSVVRIERSVSTLEEDNRRLRAEVDRIDRQLIETNARLGLLVDFVKDALSDRVDRKVEEAIRRRLDDERSKPS